VNIVDPKTSLNMTDVGGEMYRLIIELYPICRSITGNGVRKTLHALKRHIPLTIQEVPSGTRVFDWTVPKEWNIRDAYIKNSKGERIVDFQKCNLHVVSYSVPVRKKVSLIELKDHLFTSPDHPDWIPYRTSYYKETWGFCLAYNQLQQLRDQEYEVCIDSSLEEGHLTYGEYSIEGKQPEEVLLSVHTCHPSLCNDNLSGIVLSAFLAKHLNETRPRYSYRFLFIPGTIGSITWLALNEASISGIRHGLVLACLGDSGKLTYKKSRQADTEIDKAAGYVLKHFASQYEILDFSPYGYDERQFCSPGFNLPVGCLMRTPHGRFPEYHTSGDNLDFVQPPYLADSFQKCWSILEILESNGTFLNRNPKCEPQLGKRGLYGSLGGQADGKVRELAMLWVLNMSDGSNSLLDIAEKSGLDFNLINNAAHALLEHDLLQKAD
jgi:aminopeptidase-like protein